MASEPVGRTLILLDAATLQQGASDLAASDARFASLLNSNGLPPLWERSAGFPTLVKIILEQQVSLDSAAAAYTKLVASIGMVAPEAFLQLSDSELKTIGFSRQKTGYCRGLAAGVVDGSVDLDHLGDLEDDAARSYLTSIRGIGPWTADVYMLFALRRPDVWPAGDRALVVSMRENLGLAEIPTYDTAEVLAVRWKPWRSVAARMLWHGYLIERGRSLD